MLKLRSFVLLSFAFVLTSQAHALTDVQKDIAVNKIKSMDDLYPTGSLLNNVFLYPESSSPMQRDDIANEFKGVKKWDADNSKWNEVTRYSNSLMSAIYACHFNSDCNVHLFSSMHTYKQHAWEVDYIKYFVLVGLDFTEIVAANGPEGIWEAKK